MIEKLNEILQGIIKSLIQMDSGYVKPPSVSANSYIDIDVTFNVTFLEPPTVVPILYGVSTAGKSGLISLAVVPDTTTTTGCTIRMWNGDTSTRNPSILWLAALNRVGGVQ